jgi:phage replication O-like protein O
MPQLEDGYTRIADELLEALIRTRIPGQAGQVLLFIIRKTYGFNKKEDAISLSQFESATGLSKSRVCHCIGKLEGMNLITKYGKDGMTIYMINKQYSSWMPLPKKETIAKKLNRRCEKSQSALPNMGHTIDTSTIDTLTIDKDIVLFFEKIWKRYPMKAGKKAALRHYKASVKSEQDVAACELALDNYLEHLKQPQNSYKHPMNGSTWFNNWQDWHEWIEPAVPDEKPKYDPKADEKARMAGQEIRHKRDAISKALGNLSYARANPGYWDDKRIEQEEAFIARNEREIKKLRGEL